MFKTLFGPVPSRRLGISLGIDLVPYKFCSMDCIYCECGPTTDLIFKRDEYVKLEIVKDELKKYFDENPLPDYCTFSGSGEPTLNSKIGKVIDFLKKNYPVKIALLTNSTFLWDKKLRNELSGLDLILPSLDAAREVTMNKINRPHDGISPDLIIEGLIKFREETNVEMWLEVFILEGVNDGEEDLLSLKDTILKIKPHKIQLNTLDRPGAVEGLKPASKKRLFEIVSFLGFENVEIISKFRDRREIPSYSGDIENLIYSTIKRRPCTIEDLISITKLNVSEINKYLDVLEKDGKVLTLMGERGVFFKVAK